MDAASGRVLYEQNADAKMLIASTTKIMTALVAIREGEPSDVVTVSREAAYTEGSAMYLSVGEELTLETLLYGLMLCSGNDAAVAIAEHIGGSTEGFVAMMNATAKELGLSSTSFANPNGLDAKTHYSTARDMAKLACAAMENETFARIVSTKSVSVCGRTMSNHNKLLSISCAERNGQRMIAVTLQDGNDWVDHQTLFDYGFSTYPSRSAVVRGETVCLEEIENGTAASVPLVASESFSWPVKEGEALESRVELSRSLKAPLTAGEKCGEAVISLNGQEIGRVALLCGKTVGERPMTAWNVLKINR